MDERPSPLDRYDQDDEFRARISALYDGSRPRFIGTVIDLALGEGYERREAVAFAREVAARVAAEKAAPEAPAPRKIYLAECGEYDS